ncbi:virion structural protein [Pseudomonas phage D6]|nr:virion structural protein [Pseudomonas phage D6]
MVIQFKRGTTAQAAAWVGAEGSLFVDLTTKLVYVHDGVTAGGSLVGGLSTAAVNQLIDDKLDAQTLTTADIDGLDAALAATVKTTDVGTSVASLVAGKVPVAQVPDLDISKVTDLQDALDAKADAGDVPVKATGAELIAGTDDAKFATSASLLALLTDIGFTKDGNGDWKLDAGVVQP